jgi:hypothetical protein
MTPVDAILSEFSGASIFFEQLEGNHGDSLITKGARICFERHGMKVVETPSQDDIIIINGGGGYGVELPGNDFSLYKHYFQSYKKTPIVVLPSGFLIKSFPLASIFLAELRNLF